MPGARCRAPFNRVDLHEQDIVALDFVEQWVEGRVACVAAVPVRLALDLNCLKEGRQTGRGHDVIGPVPGRDVATCVGSGLQKSLDYYKYTQQFSLIRLVMELEPIQKA